jgi:predicted hydrolase (HD superfamily)
MKAIPEPILANLRIDHACVRIMSLEKLCMEPTSMIKGLARAVRELEEKFDIGGVQLGQFQFGLMSYLMNFIM